MVGAVCEADGFGMLVLGFTRDLEAIKKMIAEVRDLEVGARKSIRFSQKSRDSDSWEVSRL